MKKIFFSFMAAAAIISCHSSSENSAANTNDTTTASSSSASEAKAENWEPIDSATAMKSMMDAGTPGPQQAMLAKSNGTWTAETTSWSAPDAPPQQGTATSVNKMILGGRYQQSVFKGKFGDWPFEGTGTTGYDNTKKVFFTNWVDNMSTGIVNMEGVWDEASKSIDFKGKFICPANGKECEMREVFTIVDDNTQVMEMYGPDLKTGKSYKSMEVKLKRKS